jgi:hypothetical protein
MYGILQMELGANVKTGCLLHVHPESSLIVCMDADHGTVDYNIDGLGSLRP